MDHLAPYWRPFDFHRTPGLELESSNGFLLHLLLRLSRVSDVSLRVYRADDGPVRSVLLSISS